MKRALVVETVTGRTMAELVAARDRAQADIVELRADYASDIDVAQALAGRRSPVIFTCRASWEGGRFQGGEEERLQILKQAIEAGAEYVDIEWKADRRGLPKPATGQIVLSHHDFSGTPSDVGDRVRAMLAEKPDVLKISVTALQLRDCLKLRDAATLDVPHVAIAMGPAGQVSRLFPGLYGSLWTYGGTAAPGQVSAADLRDRFRIAAQNDDTAIYGVAGKPLAHSASPAMHNAAFATLGMNAVYLPFETDDADELLEVAKAFGVRGLSVTAPLKTAVFARAKELDDLGRQTKSINTLRFDDGGWDGRNYDIPGFLAPFIARAFPLKDRRAVILGSGGSARTAAFALRSQGARVEISARRPDAAAALAQELSVSATAFPPTTGWDLLVNTTPVGTWPTTKTAPIPREAVRGGAVYDLIYNPEETCLLEWARAGGAMTIGGLEMLVGQAGHQFRWWTGYEPPTAVMLQAARAFVERAREP